MKRFRKYWPFGAIFIIGLIAGMLVIHKPTTEMTSVDLAVFIPKTQYNTLKSQYDALKFNYDSLKKSCDESKDWREQYNALVDDIRVAQVENAALKGQLQTLTSQYQSALNALSGNQGANLEELEAMNRRLDELNEYYKVLNEQVKMVNSKGVQLLSDNLTDAEYKAFYKGWNLWWGTWND